MKIRKRLKWLFGYQVTFATTDKLYHVKHRFLREPLMWTEVTTNHGMRGKSFTAIYFDEWCEQEDI